MSHKIVTDSHELTLDANHRYTLRRTGPSTTDDSWLESRRGEAFNRNLQVRLTNDRIELFFENSSIGFLDARNAQHVQTTRDFVIYWNKNVGPTDIETIKTIELLVRWPELVVPRNLKLKCCTYNCAGSLADICMDSHSFEALLGPKLELTNCGILALGFQETDNLKSSYKANQQTLKTASEHAMAYLSLSHTLVSSQQLLGIMTLVFVSNEYADEVSNLKLLTTSTGLLGIWANKGATSTQFSLFKDPILGGGIDVQIVNAHLSAGSDVTQLKRRRWELREIGSSFKIPNLAKEEADADFSLNDERLERGSQNDSLGTNGYSNSSNSNSSSNPSNSNSNSKSLGPSLVVDSDDEDDEGERELSLATSLPEQSPSPVSEHSVPINGPIASPKSQKSQKSQKSPAAPTSPRTPRTPRTPGTVASSEQELSTPNLPKTPHTPHTPRNPRTTRTTRLSTTKPASLTVFMGDLNYRVLLPESEVQQRSKAHEYTRLLSFDSLLLEHNLGNIFAGFQEAQVAFAPTYKYDIGSNEFTNRVPSYTDRILFRSSSEAHVYEYTSLNMTNSDHKPVSLDLGVLVDCVDSSERSQVAEESMKLKDEAENRARPMLAVNPQQVVLEGQVLTTQTTTLAITNEGTRPVHWTVELASDSRDLDPFSAEPFTASNSLNLSSGKQLATAFVVNPQEDEVSMSRPVSKLRITAQLGVHPRDLILLVKTRSGKHVEDSVHKYVGVKLEPFHSYLGMKYEEMPLNPETGVCEPVVVCCEYLEPRIVKDAFVRSADPQLFQQTLATIDNDSGLDMQTLASFDSLVPNASVHAVAHVLMLLVKYMQKPLPEPLVEYLLHFVKRIEKKTSSEAFNTWACLLYPPSEPSSPNLDEKEKSERTSSKEKRQYLKGLLSKIK